MGRRAKKAPVQTKKKVKLAKTFKCPFCANDDTVECKMDFKNSKGSLTCRLCGAAYTMPIHHLHEPIDVFSEWLDDCEAAAEQRAAATGGGGDGSGGAGVAEPQYDDELEDDDDDDDIPASSGLGQKPAASSGKAGGSNKNNASIDLGLASDDDDEE